MDVIKNRIPVVLDPGCRMVTGPYVSYQHDIVQYLVISGIELPTYYEVDFCSEGDAQTVTMVGDASGVRIPDACLLTGKNIKAYVVLTGDDEGAVETRYEIKLPVRKRPARTDIQPTPAERQEIDELVENMNDAVQRAGNAAEDAEGSARSAASDAEKAEEAVFHYPKIVDGYWYVWTPDGWRTTGVKAAGRGISDFKIKQVDYSARSSTYLMTISFTDYTSYQFAYTVANGFSPTANVTKDGDTATITIIDVNGTTTATVKDGDSVMECEDDGDGNITITTTAATSA